MVILLFCLLLLCVTCYAIGWFIGYTTSQMDEIEQKFGIRPKTLDYFLRSWFVTIFSNKGRPEMETAINPKQTELLKNIVKTGKISFDGIDKRTVNALARRGFVKIGKTAITPTARGKKFLN